MSKKVLVVEDKPGKQPLSRAKKTTREGTGFRVAGGNIAAIDFGTTFVSVAYCTEGNDSILTIKLDDTKQLDRVPNAILLCREFEGTQHEVHSIGYRAQDAYPRLRPQDKMNYVYIERIKMLMRRDEDICRDQPVRAFNGEEYYLVEVIAFILKHLKNCLIGRLQKMTPSIKTTDFDWVITVPAIWDARGKGMMREAAYMAGLLSEKEGITRFTPLGIEVPRPLEDNPDKLSLALEPEVAAIYSQNKVVSEIDEAKTHGVSVSKSKGYMVVDIGGGTVDITAHIEDRGGGVQVVSLPTGNSAGGTQVNEQFSLMLQAIVDDPDFQRFLYRCGSDNTVKHRAALNKILYSEFENQKLQFGDKYDARKTMSSEEICVSLDSAFVKYYSDEKIEKGVSKYPGVEYEDNQLYIPYKVVEETIFGRINQDISDCTIHALKDLEEHRHQIDTIYLVGGFGGCLYMYSILRLALADQLPGTSYRVVVPTSRQLAIAVGAVMWRRDPAVIKGRRADATYGTPVTIKFDESIHDPYYKVFDKQDNCYNVYVLQVFLQKREMASINDVFVSAVTPPYPEITELSFKIYSSRSRYVQYMTDKNGEPTVELIGELVIDVPNPDNLPIEERVVDVTMDFSGTEIQARARYRVTGKEVKTVCDFLSARHT